MIKKITFFFFTTLLVCMVVVFIYFFRYRYIPHVAIKNKSEIMFKNIEGYTNKLSYKISDTILISLNAKKKW